MKGSTAAWVYIVTLIWPLVCLTYWHVRGRIDLFSAITTTKGDKTFVDGKKLAFVGAFAVGATAFAYLAVTDRFTEWYASLFFLFCAGGKYLGDREQRLQKAIDAQTPAAQP